MFESLTQIEMLFASSAVFIIFFLGYKIGNVFAFTRDKVAIELFGLKRQGPSMVTDEPIKDNNNQAAENHKKPDRSRLPLTQNLVKYQKMLG